MERPSIWKTNRPVHLAARPEPSPLTDEFLDALTLKDDDSCCCGRPANDPGRCSCTGDPESGADCCCRGL